MLDHILNSGSYRKLNKNPIRKISKEVALALNSNNIPSPLKKKLIISNPITPRTYELPKINKNGVPIMLIVNTLGGPTYLLAKFLVQKLTPLVVLTQPFVMDSTRT